jgi:hypothetical protein
MNAEIRFGRLTVNQKGNALSVVLIVVLLITLIATFLYKSSRSHRKQVQAQANYSVASDRADATIVLAKVWLDSLNDPPAELVMPFGDAGSSLPTGALIAGTVAIGLGGAFVARWWVGAVAAAAFLLALGIGFIAVAILLILAYYLTWPGALALIGALLLVGAAVFTYLKVRSIQT